MAWTAVNYTDFLQGLIFPSKLLKSLVSLSKIKMFSCICWILCSLSGLFSDSLGSWKFPNMSNHRSNTYFCHPIQWHQNQTLGRHKNFDSRHQDWDLGAVATVGGWSWKLWNFHSWRKHLRCNIWYPWDSTWDKIIQVLFSLSVIFTFQIFTKSRNLHEFIWFF